MKIYFEAVRDTDGFVEGGPLMATLLIGAAVFSALTAVLHWAVSDRRVDWVEAVFYGVATFLILCALAGTCEALNHVFPAPANFPGGY